MWRRISKSKKGQSLVELALVLPILLLLLLGFLDLGRAYYYEVAITNAAREGARYGALFPKDDPGIRDTVVRAVQPYITVQNDANHIEISPPVGQRDPQSPLEVRIKYEFNLKTGLLMDRLFRVNPLTIEGSAKMMIYGD